MEESKYITFSKEDIVLALEDYYYKNKGLKIDIAFGKNRDEMMLSGISNIVVKVVLFEKEEIKGELVVYEPREKINMEKMDVDPFQGMTIQLVRNSTYIK